jgi:hypothetical protein
VITSHSPHRQTTYTHTHTHTHTHTQFGYDFLPAVFESFGAIGHCLAEHIQNLENEYLNLHVEEAFGGCTFAPRWRERFSVALQNGMASKIIGHCNRLHIPLSLSPFDSAFPPVSSSAGC